MASAEPNPTNEVLGQAETPSVASSLTERQTPRPVVSIWLPAGSMVTTWVIGSGMPPDVSPSWNENSSADEAPSRSGAKLALAVDRRGRLGTRREPEPDDGADQCGGRHATHPTPPLATRGSRRTDPALGAGVRSQHHITGCSSRSAAAAASRPRGARA